MGGGITVHLEESVNEVGFDINDPVLMKARASADKGKQKQEPRINPDYKALKNAAPVVEVKSKRIGGATYQVPIDIPDNRRMALAMRWIISFARSRKGNSMVDRLSAELISASKNEGSTIKKKEDTHKMAEANKAFSHFR